MAVEWPRAAYADVIWPALYIETRRLEWVWPIALGLLIEWGLIRSCIIEKWSRSIVAAVGVNLISTLVGVIAVPLFGIVGSLPEIVFHYGTFDILGWCVEFIAIVLGNAALETGILRIMFKVPFTRRVFLLMCLANALSVGVAVATLFYEPMHM